MTIDHTHDASATSWVPGADDHADFPVQNLPLGMFSRNGGSPRAGCAIGEHVLDLRGLSEAGQLPQKLNGALGQETLNDLFDLGRPALRELRHTLFALLTDEAHADAVKLHLFPASECAMHMPFRVGDYTDFYVGIHHATNIGKQFRPDNPLLPNYKHVPIGYHGRASSLRVSGEPVIRPRGQVKAPDAEAPVLAASKRLDMELELGVWIAGHNELGQPVAIEKAWERIGGLCILNDWSARDLQAWEYQPLGPFLAKNFLSTVSPWVVTADALEPFRVEQAPRPEGDPQPLPYLFDKADQKSGALALTLDVTLSSSAMREAGTPPLAITHGTSRSMYWTTAQIVTHHTVNGCNLEAGDLLGTGTISGPERGALGSLMEMTLSGKEPLQLPSGEMRGFLEDGDEIVMTAHAEREGFRTIGLGVCSGTVRPAAAG